MSKYRYIHFFMHNSTLFNIQFQNFIEENATCRNQLFVYRYRGEEVSKKHQMDTVYDKNIDNVSSVNKYLKKGCCIVVHNLAWEYSELKKIDNIDAQKIIWCVWGGDLYRYPKKLNFFWSGIRSIYHVFNGKYMTQYIAKQKICMFNGIVASFIGDRNYVKQKLHYNGKLYNAVYPMGYWKEDIDRWTNEGKTYKPKEKLNILIGHSGFSFLKHEKYLRKLLKYKNKINIVLPLNYGDDGYIEYIAELAEKLYSANELTIIRENMSQENYCKLLMNIDIAVLDFEHQAALGNIYLLMYLKKHIYLNSKGILYNSFRKLGLTVFDCDIIGHAELKQLHVENDFTKNRHYATEMFDKNIAIQRWNEILLED